MLSFIHLQNMLIPNIKSFVNLGIESSRFVEEGDEYLRILAVLKIPRTNHTSTFGSEVRL